jgi:hypothetical protein
MCFICRFFDHVHLHRRLTHLTRVHEHVLGLMEDIMVDFSKVKAEQARLVEDVTALRSVTAGVAVVILGQVTQLHDLADQIAQLKAGSVSQEDIDALASSTHDLADSVEAGTAEVTAAVTAGTPVANEPPGVEPIVPVA